MEQVVYGIWREIGLVDWLVIEVIFSLDDGGSYLILFIVALPPLSCTMAELENSVEDGRAQCDVCGLDFDCGWQLHHHRQKCVYSDAEYDSGDSPPSPVPLTPALFSVSPLAPPHRPPHLSCPSPCFVCVLCVSPIHFAFIVSSNNPSTPHHRSDVH